MGKTDLSLKERTAQGLMWGGFSNGLQQLLNLFFGIWMSRILSVSDYGVIGVLTIFTLIATTLQESGFTQAIANKKDATLKDFNAIFWCSSSIGLLLYVILYFLAPFIAEFFYMSELTKLSRFLFLGFLLSSFGTAYSAYLFKNLMVKQRSISILIGLLTSGVVGITLAYNGYAYWGLATQHLTYVFVTNSLFFLFSRWRPRFEFSFATIRELLPFSSIILVTKIFTHINEHIFNIIIGRLYNKVEVGYFSQSNKWNLMGSSIITGMIHGVAQPVLRNVEAESQRQKRVFLKLLRFTSFISFPLLFGLAYVAPQFIEIALTEKWLQSAYILQILCIGGAFIPINNLLGNLLISQGKSINYMFTTIIIGLLQVGIAILLYPKGIQTMIIGAVAIQIMGTLIWFSFARTQIKLSLIEFLKEIIPYAFTVILAILLSSYLISAEWSLVITFILKIFIVGTLYLAILAICRASILRECYLHLRESIFKR